MKKINRLHLPKTAAKAELVSKMAVKKWNTMPNTNLRLEHSDWENRTTFSDVPLFAEMFRSIDPR